MNSLVWCHIYAGKKPHASSVGCFNSWKQNLYPWWNGILLFCIYKDFFSSFFFISLYYLEDWLWKKQHHTLVFQLTGCILMSHLIIKPMFTSKLWRYCATLLAIIENWNIRDAEMWSKGSELAGKCIRQHFKISLFHCAADFAYLFLYCDFIFQYNVFGLYWHPESYGWQGIRNILM